MTSSIWLICQYTYDTQRHWVPLPLRIVDTDPVFRNDHIAKFLIEPLRVVCNQPDGATVRIRLLRPEPSA